MNLNLKFAANQQDFYATCKQRVNAYFKNNNLERTANTEMVFKTITMFSLYFIPYAIMLSGIVNSIWGYLAATFVMGLGLAGIGLSIMHDANHGAYSSKPWVNYLLGMSLNLVGGHAFNWKVQHNVLHHTYTNIHEADEDISPRGILRMSPSSDWKSIHRFQHYYAWFFYGLMTIVWISFKDFMRLLKYEKDGLVKKQKASAVKEWFLMIATKFVYISYIFVIPVVVLPLAWWQILLGILMMHYIAGFILAIIFQPAHVIDGTEYPLPDEGGNLENNWAVHQMKTTTNFGHRHKLLSWYVGGLNYQVEHHLFPNVCHVHYRNISVIVKQTAHEFGVPYKSKDTFWEAIAAHAVILKELGKKPTKQSKMSLAA